MRFIIDEGVDTQIVETLRKEGHDILYIAEFASGSTDDVILKFANEDDRILMTRDKDFGELVFRDRMIHSGIILNRLYELQSDKKAQVVAKVIKDFKDELKGAFTVIQPNKLRIRKL